MAGVEVREAEGAGAVFEGRFGSVPAVADWASLVPFALVADADAEGEPEAEGEAEASGVRPAEASPGPGVPAFGCAPSFASAAEPSGDSP